MLSTEYETYLDALDVTVDQQAPVELLARSGGTRATDAVHIVPEPPDEPDGRQVLLLLASGPWHLESARERIPQLSAGVELLLRPDPENPVNPNPLVWTAPRVLRSAGGGRHRS